MLLICCGCQLKACRSMLSPRFGPQWKSCTLHAPPAALPHAPPLLPPDFALPMSSFCHSVLILCAAFRNLLGSSLLSLLSSLSPLSSPRATRFVSFHCLPHFIPSHLFFSRVAGWNPQFRCILLLIWLPTASLLIADSRLRFFVNSDHRLITNTIALTAYAISLISHISFVNRSTPTPNAVLLFVLIWFSSTLFSILFAMICFCSPLFV